MRRKKVEKLKIQVSQNKFLVHGGVSLALGKGFH